jgi:hypothetical protein
MKCEEFESVGWELGRAEGALSAAESAELHAAREHARRCPRCAALQESWQEVHEALGSLRAATREAQAPPRVEMRLRQEFRRRYRAGKIRATAMVTAWALATAAVTVTVVAVSWWSWRSAQHHTGTPSAISGGANLGGGATKKNPTDGGDISDEPTLMADSDAGDFTLLPGSLPQETDDAAIVRVRLQRRALGALGLPVNEERAADWLQVDLLVGEDGQPRAVRLPSE